MVQRNVQDKVQAVEIPKHARMPSAESVRRKMQRGMGRDLNTEEEARISVLLAQLAKRFGQQEQQHRLEQQCQVKRAASRTDPSKLPCLEEPAPLEFDDIDFGPDFVSDLD